jgi:hypothetical protein
MEPFAGKKSGQIFGFDKKKLKIKNKRPNFYLFILPSRQLSSCLGYIVYPFGFNPLHYPHVN